jgi:hypothetical protein
LPGNLSSAVLSNTTQALSFAFLIILAQLTRYDRRIDEAASGPLLFGLQVALDSEKRELGSNPS